MNVTPAVLDAIFFSFVKNFQDGYSRADKWALQVATEIPSSSRSLRHAWMKWIPRLREWIGERKINNVAARGFAVDNKDYELTQAVGRNDIEDDQIAVYGPLLAMMGQQAALWPEDLMTTIMSTGKVGLCFDGQPYFSASHPVDTDDSSKGTYSNLFTTTALTSANYGVVRQAMLAYKAEDGKPMKVRPNLLVVPPALEWQARQILNAEFTAPAAAFGQNAAGQMQTNVLRNSADILVVPDLNIDPTVWYLMDTTKPVKPFIFQLRKSPTLVALTDPTGENLFYRKEYVYGVDSRGAAAYGLPFLCARAEA